MSMITKAHLIDELAERNQISKKEAEKTLNDVISLITWVICFRGGLSLHGFGTFEIRKRPARRGRNPKTGEAIMIPRSTTVKFKPSKTLRDDAADPFRDR